MPKRVDVTPEDLAVAAATVDAHADEVRARHRTADGRIEAAQAGIPAGSAAAIGSAVTKWQADTTTIFSRMIGHADGLRVGAASYQQADEASAGRVDGAARRIGDLDLGL